VKHPDVGDPKVPLHVRLVERQRLILVASVNLAETVSGRCEDPDYTPSQLLDATFSQHMHEAIRCRNDEADAQGSTRSSKPKFARREHSSGERRSLYVSQATVADDQLIDCDGKTTASALGAAIHSAAVAMSHALNEIFGQFD
jgi:hypothetical protein